MYYWEISRFENDTWILDVNRNRKSVLTCSKNSETFFLRPDVPGFCPGKGLVGTTLAVKALVILVYN